MIRTEKLLELIIQGCIKNKRSSQKELYQHFYAYAMSICLRYTGQEADAVEVLNDAFFKVFKNIKKYDQSMPFKPWLRRIIVNACLDHLKKQVKHEALTDIQEAQTKEATSQLPDHDLNYEEILKKVGQLSPAYRAVFNLYVIDGYKHSEIAEQLGVTESTSKANLTRAKAILRKELREEVYQYG